MDDCDDEWFLEAAKISEANAMLENTKTAAAESTSAEGAISPNHEIVNFFADVDDHWLVQIANSAEASLLSKEAKITTAESTSERVQTAEKTVSSDQEMVDLGENIEVNIANSADADSLSKEAELTVAESTPEIVQTAGDTASSDHEMIAVDIGKNVHKMRRNVRVESLNLHSRPKRVLKKSEKSTAVSEQKKNASTKKPKKL